MEALHQLAELFQQAVTKSNNTSISVAPPKSVWSSQTKHMWGGAAELDVLSLFVTAC